MEVNSSLIRVRLTETSSSPDVSSRNSSSAHLSNASALLISVPVQLPPPTLIHLIDDAAHLAGGAALEAINELDRVITERKHDLEKLQEYADDLASLVSNFLGLQLGEGLAAVNRKIIDHFKQTIEEMLSDAGVGKTVIFATSRALRTFLICPKACQQLRTLYKQLPGVETLDDPKPTELKPVKYYLALFVKLMRVSSKETKAQYEDFAVAKREAEEQGMKLKVTSKACKRIHDSVYHFLRNHVQDGVKFHVETRAMQSLATSICRKLKRIGMVETVIDHVYKLVIDMILDRKVMEVAYDTANADDRKEEYTNQKNGSTHNDSKKHAGSSHSQHHSHHHHSHHHHSHHRSHHRDSRKKDDNSSSSSSLNFGRDRRLSHRRRRNSANSSSTSSSVILRRKQYRRARRKAGSKSSSSSSEGFGKKIRDKAHSLKRRLSRHPLFGSSSGSSSSSRSIESWNDDELRDHYERLGPNYENFDPNGKGVAARYGFFSPLESNDGFGNIHDLNRLDGLGSTDTQISQWARNEQDREAHEKAHKKKMDDAYRQLMQERDRRHERIMEEEAELEMEPEPEPRTRHHRRHRHQQRRSSREYARSSRGDAGMRRHHGSQPRGRRFEDVPTGQLDRDVDRDFVRGGGFRGESFRAAQDRAHRDSISLIGDKFSSGRGVRAATHDQRRMPAGAAFAA